jgi:hypothetical protein
MGKAGRQLAARARPTFGAGIRKLESWRRGLGDSPIAQEMLKTLQYYWNAARGYRFKPWESPYIRWRFETFLGKEAANLTAGKFFHLAWKYRDHMERFVDWAAERQRFQRRRHA